MGSEDASLLALVLDASVSTWALAAGLQAPASAPQQHRPREGGAGAGEGGVGVAVMDYMNQVAAFLNAFLLLNDSNRIAVIASGSYSSSFLFPQPSQDGAKGAPAASPQGSQAVEPIMKRLTQFMRRERDRAAGAVGAGDADRNGAKGEGEEEGEREDGGGGKGRGEGGRGQVGAAALPSTNLLAASLSMALTYSVKALRIAQQGQEPQPRILCMHGSTDAPQQYVAIMNAIFSSQKHKIPIDSLIIGPRDSAFLQQAAFLTEGSYWKLKRGQTLLQWLLLLFGPDRFSRTFLHLPKPAGVDFRAACFCHKKTIDMGYVCSVCLSIFCSRSPSCATCGSTLDVREAC